MAPEQHVTRLSFFGRLADGVTRRVLSPAEMQVSVVEDPRPPLLKDDGHFAVADLAPSASDYHLRLGGPAFQTRTVAKALPTTAPVQVTFAGEDEVYLSLTAAPTPQNRITFEALPFVPTVAKGAAVIGESGFTATLAESLEGLNVSTATLSATGGLASGQLLRVVRGPNLLLRAAPWYPFPGGLTVVALHVVVNDPAEPPIEGATITLTQVNGAAPATVTAGTLTLRRFALAGPSRLILDDAGRIATSSDRGDAVFVFPGEKAITNVTLSASKPQFVTSTVTLAVTAKTRNFQKISLTHV